MNKKLRQLKRDLKAVCRGHGTALWFSGGKDSRLLFEVIQAEGLDCVLLRFDDGWSREQKDVVDRIVARKNAAVYSWKPHTAVLVGNGKDIASVAEYGIGPNGESLPVIRDLVDGKKCAFDVRIGSRKTRKPPVSIQRHVVGSKASDRHFIFGNKSLIPSKEFSIGSVEIFAPLFAWTDAEVVKELKNFGVEHTTPPDELDTGNHAVCTKCLRGSKPVRCPKTDEMIAAVEWSPKENLKAWRKEHGIEVR